MRKRVITITAIVFGALMLVCVLMWTKNEIEPRSLSQRASSDTNAKTPDHQKELVQPLGAPPREAHEKNLLIALAEAVQKPIHLYGLVVDQEGNPVPGASVNYSVSNKLTDTGIGNTRGETASDPAGRFEIRAHGMGITVRVSKEGYYQIRGDDPRSSVRGFYNGDNPGKSDNLIPPSSAPAVFALRKMGNAVPLVQLPRRSVMVAKDGTPTEISITTGKITPSGKGDLRVEAWTNDQTPNAKGHYDWRCRITVPDGGLTEAEGNFAFEAPEDGYTQSIEFGEKADQPRWLGDAERQYFVRLPDGRHARIKLRMIAAGEHFFVIESALNPEPGNRNLEAAPENKPAATRPIP